MAMVYLADDLKHERKVALKEPQAVRVDETRGDSALVHPGPLEGC